MSGPRVVVIDHWPTNLESRAYHWVTQVSGASFPIEFAEQVTYDGVDYWTGKDQLSGIMKDTGMRSAIVKVETPTDAQLAAWWEKQRLVYGM